MIVCSPLGGNMEVTPARYCACYLMFLLDIKEAPEINDFLAFCRAKCRFLRWCVANSQVIGCCHEHADGAADGQQLPQSVLWWAAVVGHLPADPAVDFDRRDPGGARARSLEHHRKLETARAAHLGHGLRRGTLGLALSSPRRRRGGADLVGRAPHARGQGSVIALPRRADSATAGEHGEVAKPHIMPATSPPSSRQRPRRQTRRSSPARGDATLPTART